jgi:hypothetical protein
VASPVRKKSFGRKLLGVAAAGSVATAALWVAVHEIPWLGPALAEGARSLVGPGPVAKLEDVTYGVADRVRLLVGGDERPKTYWEAPADVAPEAAITGAPEGSKDDGARPLAPARVTPPFDEVAASGDGGWLAVAPPGSRQAPAMWKTLIHPDPKRPFAAVAIVAIDRNAIDLHVAPGTDEPKAPQIPNVVRSGLVPQKEQPQLVAAFNGGFRAMHGNYGMMAGGVTFIPPRDIACTVAFFTPGKSKGEADAQRPELAIRTWSKIADRREEMSAFRQTPPCLVENGEPNPGLLSEFNRNWGATVGGDTIIRRSAIGISKDRRHLFYALGDAVTAQSIGRAMQVVGAHDAAQLDVNYSYPRFVLFEQNPNGFPIATSPIVPDVKFSPTDYVVGAQQRDFFYLTRKKTQS